MKISYSAGECNSRIGKRIPLKVKKYITKFVVKNYVIKDKYK